MRRPRGRPTKFTPEVEDRIIDLIRQGNTQKDAAAIVGVDETMVGRHKRDFADFADRMKKAEAEFIASKVRIVEKAADGGTWQAAAWILERRRPETWGRRLLEAEKPAEDTAEPLNYDALTDEQLDILEQLLRPRRELARGQATADAPQLPPFRGDR